MSEENIMASWSTDVLKSVVEFIVDNRGKNPPYAASGYEVIETACISGKNKYPDYTLIQKYVDTTTYQTWFRKGHPQQGDLVIITVGNGIGAISIMKSARGVLTQNLIGVRLNPRKASPDFYYYFLSQPSIQQYLRGLDIGSAQPSLKVPHLLNTAVPIPPIAEQQAIADVLNSLDAKIDLLHRQNTTLEAMAETLFRQWFIEEAREEWDYIQLGSYVNCLNGVSYKSSDLNPSTTAMVTLKSFDRTGGFRLDGFKEYTGRHKPHHIVTHGDVVVAHTDITQEAEVIGNPARIIANDTYKTLVISMDVVKVVPRYAWLSREFLYMLMKTRSFKEHCLGYSNGSTVLHLSKEAVPSFEFFLPPFEKIQHFTDLSSALFKKRDQNIASMQKLEQLRNTLLPKLMSGEVRVAY